jgi:hypothetical protein
MDDELQYDVMVESALRGVVRQALQQVAHSGLPGEHHFYITFRTEHSGVEMSPDLRAQYPGEMTIVLQYQFWDLDVGAESFSVTLSFNNRSEHLHVPFDAVVAFADPSVRFGLQFDAGESAEEADGTETGAAESDGQTAQDTTVSEGASQAGDKEDGTNVVTLDRFRKT